MTGGKWAPDNAEGLHAYVRSEWSWGKEHREIRYAASLKDAKAKFGWTSMKYTRIEVRRATPEDVAQ